MAQDEEKWEGYPWTTIRSPIGGGTKRLWVKQQPLDTETRDKHGPLGRWVFAGHCITLVSWIIIAVVALGVVSESRFLIGVVAMHLIQLFWQCGWVLEAFFFDKYRKLDPIVGVCMTAKAPQIVGQLFFGICAIIFAALNASSLCHFEDILSTGHCPIGWTFFALQWLTFLVTVTWCCFVSRSVYPSV